VEFLVSSAVNFTMVRFIIQTPNLLGDSWCNIFFSRNLVWYSFCRKFSCSQVLQMFEVLNISPNLTNTTITYVLLYGSSNLLSYWIAYCINFPGQVSAYTCITTYRGTMNNLQSPTFIYVTSVFYLISIWPTNIYVNN
jgi:hypothetical protein